MALAVDLIGLGIPPEQAVQLGTQVIAVNAAGTAQGTATELSAATTGNIAYIVTPAASQQGVRLPTGGAIGATVEIYPTAATPLITIYPATGQTINTLSANTGVAMTTANKNAYLRKMTATNWRLFISGAA